MSRPREFDENQALDQAMHLFWRHGYEGTSLRELTRAMGINRPSLYAAFGNKESLFRKAVDRYVTGPGSVVAAALEAPTGREAVERLFEIYAAAPGEPGRPPGCLMVGGALRCGAGSEPVGVELAEKRRASVTALRRRLERAQREGDLTASVSAAELAHFVWTVLHGMSIEATSGATPAQLRRIAARAMHAWPGDRGRKRR
jgi:AcrR family transcriptional regulator